MNHTTTSCLLISIILFASSCVNTILKIAGITDTESEYFIMSNGTKTIAFIPMHHVGTQQFYESVARTVDSFQKEGFHVFYEAVMRPETDSLSEIIYKKKFRKIMGISSTKYYDSTNQTLAGQLKYTGTHTLMNQPSYTELGVDTSRAENIDVNLSALIDDYEKNHGEVVLETCDIDTDLQDTYTCNTLSNSKKKIFFKDYIQAYRDDHIVHNIIQSSHSKILIIYGRRHYKGIQKRLTEQDSLWKSLKK